MGEYCTETASKTLVKKIREDIRINYRWKLFTIVSFKTGIAYPPDSCVYVRNKFHF